MFRTARRMARFSVALLCDKYFKRFVIEAAPMNFFIDARECVRRLDYEAFNKDENHALEGYTFDRLHECLESNFRTRRRRRPYERWQCQSLAGRGCFLRYYTLWGYCANAHQRKTERQFNDIISEYKDLRNAFLTAVDYVSLALKAKCATEALGRQIDVIMPKEYGHAVVRPQKTQLLDLGDITAADLASDPYPGITLAVEAVLNMSGKQLSDLHDLPEYREYSRAMATLSGRAVVEEVRAQQTEPIQQAFGAYLRAVERRLATDNPATLTQFDGRVVQSDNGISAHIVPREWSNNRVVLVDQPRVIEVCANNFGLRPSSGVPLQRYLNPFVASNCQTDKRDAKIFYAGM